MTHTMRRESRHLSPALAGTATALFAVGVGGGLVSYLDRSPVREAFVPGSSAWVPHGVVAGLAGAALAVAWWRHRRAGDGGRWLLAPAGRPAGRRMAATLRDGLRRPGGAGRLLLALGPVLVLVYAPLRAGWQVTNGLDPNATVNAWGGPSYLGAMACHYLDLAVLVAAACWLLGQILLPDPAWAERGGGPGQLRAATAGRAPAASSRSPRR